MSQGAALPIHTKHSTINVWSPYRNSAAGDAANRLLPSGDHDRTEFPMHPKRRSAVHISRDTSHTWRVKQELQLVIDQHNY